MWPLGVVRTATHGCGQSLAQRAKIKLAFRDFKKKIELLGIIKIIIIVIIIIKNIIII